VDLCSQPNTTEKSSFSPTSTTRRTERKSEQ
jgi:hypothetical protein